MHIVYADARCGISLVIDRYTGMTDAYEIKQWIRFAKEVGSLSEKPKMRSAVSNRR